MKPGGKKLFWVGLVVLNIIIVESSLHIASLISSDVTRFLKSPWASANVYNARLGSRPNPLYMEHDKKGFRNLKVPSKADIIALGDSQTYGNGVDREEAWPSQLQSMTHKTVYNMSFGGYGPGHYLQLWDEALTLKPDTVMVAFYAGNDLFDSFDIVYRWGQLSELKNKDPEIQNKILKLQQIDPIEERIMNVFLKNNSMSDNSKSFTGVGGGASI